MGITKALTQWIADSTFLANGESLVLARSAVIDIVGCMIAGAKDEATLCALEAVRELGSGPASVVGFNDGLTAAHAALVNGTAAHALDFDDNYHGNSSHATAVLAPALLALGEERGASGAAVLDAYIVGLEAMFIIGEGVNLAHYEKGWHTTSTIGTIGAAVSAARLMKLDETAIKNALSLGFSHASGSKLQHGTMAKPFHAGMAAKNAIMAARYAEAGMTAVDEPLEAPWGFRDLYIGFDASPGYQGVAELLSSPLAIERYGLQVKIHPNCAGTHCAVDGVLHLMDEHGLSSDQIGEIEAMVNKISYDNLMFSNPRSEMEARFSMHYAIALAVTKGRLTRSDFSSEAISNKNIRAWLPRVKMSLSPIDDPLPTVDNGRSPAKVCIRTKDGRVLTKFVQHAKGVLQNPLSEEEMWSKFNDCVKDTIDVSADETLRTMLSQFEDLERVSDLMTILRQSS